jgi:hypothetical protein
MQTKKEEGMRMRICSDKTGRPIIDFFSLFPRSLPLTLQKLAESLGSVVAGLVAPAGPCLMTDIAKSGHHEIISASLDQRTDTSSHGGEGSER